MTRLATVPRAVRSIQEFAQPHGARPSLADGNLARVDWQGRRALCSSAACGKVITRLVRIGKGSILRPVFTGEWHEGDDHVWRLTSYARALQARTANGGQSRLTRADLGLSRRRMWSDPTTWAPVVASNPCQVECSACGERQTIRLA